MDTGGSQMTVVLNAANDWKSSFTDLEKYDGEGNAYIYSVKELTIGGIPAEETDYLISVSQDDDGTAVITNIDSTEFGGTKTGRDNGNAYGSRPAELELILYRSVEGGTEEIVEAEPVWTKTGDVWSYTYSDLPKTDENSRLYTYKVKEVVPDGYTGTQSGNNFTNTLTRCYTDTVTKIWEDNGDAAGIRPDSITVILYADGIEIERHTLSAGNLLQKLIQTLSGDTADSWSYTFEDLPVYDEDGKLIQYTVKEEGVPDGYEVYYDGYTIRNVLDGNLSVSKTVSGSGDRDKAFHFTVTLSDKSINGVYGDMTFTDGIASFTLKHGETATATGLPAGATYTVVEEEADKDGYTTSADDASGIIPVGGRQQPALRILCMYRHHSMAVCLYLRR